jgi:hypothetical protein
MPDRGGLPLVHRDDKWQAIGTRFCGPSGYLDRSRKTIAPDEQGSAIRAEDGYRFRVRVRVGQ